MSRDVVAKNMTVPGVANTRLIGVGRVLVFCVALFNIAVLAGWFANIPLFDTAVHPFRRMFPNVALGFLVLCGALLLGSSQFLSPAAQPHELRDESKTNRSIKMFHNALLGFAVLIAALNIVETIFNVSLGIDDLLMHNISDVGPWPPGRMTLTTAVCFILTSSAIFISQNQRCKKNSERCAFIYQGLTLLVGTVSLQGILSYLYGTFPLFDSAHRVSMLLIPMVFETAISFLVLSVAVFCMHPRSSLIQILCAQSVSGHLVRRMLIPSVMLPVLLGWLVTQADGFALVSPGFVAAALVVGCVVLLLSQVSRISREIHELEEQNSSVVASLKLSDERFRSLVNNLDRVFWIREGKTQRLLFISPSCLQTYGFTAQEMMNFPTLSMALVVPEDRQALLAALKKVRQGEQASVEYTVEHRDGSLRRLRNQCIPLLDSEGAVYQIAGITEDITREIKNAESLLRSEEQLRLALAATKIGTFDFRPRTGELIWSQRCRALFGVSATEPVNYDLFVSRIHPDDVARVHESVCRSLDPAHTGEFCDEYRIQSLEGEKERWIETNGRAIFDLNGTASRVIGTVMDVTSKKHAEQNLEQAIRVRDEFLVTLSQELRTPINVIQGWIQLLKMESVRPEEMQNIFEIIERNATAQIQVITDLLDVSQMISGRLSVEKNNLDISTIIRFCLNKLELAIEQKALTVEYVPELLLRPVVGDQTRLEQAVWNLLSNAVKFTPERGRIRITAVQRGDRMEVAVSDSGKGISPHQLNHVFERFYKNFDDRTAVSEGIGNGLGAGLGLGLAMVRHIVDLHGGTVEVQSEGENKGATFILKLPLGQPGVASVASKAPALQNSFATLPDPHSRVSVGTQLKGLELLVVDDSEDVRELLTWILARWEVSVTTCSTAEEAFHLFSAKRFDALLSDIAMPGKDGFWLIQKIRALERVRRRTPLPAVALTAYTRETERNRCLAEGFQAFISKPVAVDELIGVLEQITRTLVHKKVSSAHLRVL